MKKNILLLNNISQFDPIDESLTDSLQPDVNLHWYQTTNDEFSLDETFNLCSNPDIIVSSYVSLPAPFLAQQTDLEAIVATSTAVDYIDLQYCQAQKIPVFNTPAYTGSAVAEHAFALIMASSKYLLASDQAVRMRTAANPPTSIELFGKRLGIIGLGSIGRRVADYAHCFGMEVVYYNRSVKAFAKGIQVDFNTLLQHSDIIVMTVPLSKETHHFIGRNELQKMKSSAVLINIGADELIHAEHLVAALQRGEIAGAGLDVIQADAEYLNVANLTLTRSRGWYTKEAIERRMNTWIETLSHYLQQTPINRVV